MNKVKLDEIIMSDNVVIPLYVLKRYKKFNLTLDELLILMYFFNKDEWTFDPERFSNELCMDVMELMGYISKLCEKGLMSLEFDKKDNRMEEHVCIKPFIDKISFNLMGDFNSKTKNENIFSIIESEFSRKLSPLEVDYIKSWQDNDYSDELIIEAVKESSINGVNNLRYIDKILYEWNKKGYKCVDDIVRDKNTEPKEIYNYNWLDDEEI